MKKLTAKQTFDLIDYVSECYRDYEDEYPLRQVNYILKILGYVNKFQYDYENGAIICDGGIEQQESE